MSSSNKRVTNNIVMLYIMNITQLILPLITLPYLTRVLSVDAYGVVSYVKSIIIYATLVIEFGFLLSATKEVVENKSDLEKLGLIVGRTIIAKLFLSLIAFTILVGMTILIPILHRHAMFTLLSFGGPFLSIFLCDYLFRGLEKMQLITYRFLIMKGIATALTFMFIKSDRQLLLIPIFDIISSLVAVGWIIRCIRQLGIKIKFDKIHNVWQSLRISSIYFLSDMAGTAFGAFNTFLVGIYLTTADVAYWGILSTLIAAVQTIYSPICDGIYPHMIESKSIRLLGKIILIFTPLLVIGGGITYFGAKIIMLVIGGAKYMIAAPYLQACVPILIITFFSNLFGWPALGAINKIKQTTLTTMMAALVQVAGLLLLIVTNHFSLVSMIFIRIFSELVMAGMRLILIYYYRTLYNY